MTKKDFIAIADTFKSSKPKEAIKLKQWELTIISMTNTLAQSNPRFDVARFRSACGFPLMESGTVNE